MIDDEKDTGECFVCEKLERLEKAEVAPMRSLAEKAYLEGLAFGFNIRHDKTFVMTCRDHSDMLVSALREAGSKPVPVSKGGMG